MENKDKIIEETINNDLTTLDNMSTLLDNLMKYTIFLEGTEEQDESEAWKKDLKPKKVPEELHKLIMQIFKTELKIIDLKSKSILKNI